MGDYSDQELDYIREWNSRTIVVGFHFPPGPTEAEAREHTARVLREELLRLPSDDEANKAAVVHAMFIWDFTEDSKCYQRDPTTLERISNVAHTPEAVWDSWLRFVQRTISSVLRFDSGLRRRVEVILNSDLDLGDKWVQGARLRASDGIPTRLPIKYAKDGRVKKVKYPWLMDLMDPSAHRVKDYIMKRLDELAREREEEGEIEGWETDSESHSDP